MVDRSLYFKSFCFSYYSTLFNHFFSRLVDMYLETILVKIQVIFNILRKNRIILFAVVLYTQSSQISSNFSKKYLKNITKMNGTAF